MNQFVIKLFVVIIVLLFLMGTIIPMIYIKNKGKDPHGTHEGISFLTRLTPFTIFSWILYLLLFLVWTDFIFNFWILDFLLIDVLIIFGMVLIGIGYLIEIIGMINLGLSFRIELPKEDTELKTSGIYRLTRNPIVLGIYVILLGSFFIIPTIISIVFFVINLITFNSKVKGEEKFLFERFGQDYRKYQKNVGRYFPKFKK